MPDKNEFKRSCAAYDSMSTEELRNLLLQNSQKTEEDDDETVEAILEITGVLAERERARLGDEFPDARRAWKTFREEYLPRLDGIPPAAPGAEVSGNLEPCAKKRTSRVRTLLRAAAVVAAVLLLFTISIGAMGFRLQDIFASWTDELFSFSDSSPERSLPDELQEVLSRQGINAGLVPEWLPEEYAYASLTELETLRFFTVNIFYRSTEDEDRKINVVITKRSEVPHSNSYEKDVQELRQIPFNHVTYYVMENLGKTRMTWRTGVYECSIAGDFGEDDAETIIHSINYREEE